ncbi:hypothetical protein [Variovorax rhizosphaerae]|uniref:Transcriptional regulator n=1 Tax=Variovorax rhizosphaerae TaxID=1836200 RepID=A0ABU8WEC0_9BURK
MKEEEMTAKLIDVFRALLTVTRAQAETFAAARALHMMPVASRTASLTSHL